MPEVKPYLLKNTIQNYAWGTKNNEAYIPKLLGIKPEKDIAYAELWMGAHPKAPSLVEINGKLLSLNELFLDYPEEFLGARVIRKFGKTLPFLYKVLSSAEALSIQVHPDKAQAEELHAADPLNYPDQNHKPEIAVALDSLQALIGIKKFNLLANTFEEYPELNSLLNLNSFKYSAGIELKIFIRLIQKCLSDPELLNASLGNIFSRLSRKKTYAELTKIDHLFINLFEKYKFDIGLIAVLLMNYVELLSGQALFTPPGIPHAYLKGNLIECMANSDNVIRAGLTPKFKDVNNMMTILRFSPESSVIKKNKIDEFSTTYEAGVSEFKVIEIKLDKAKMIETTNGGASIALCIEGEGIISWDDEKNTKIKRGDSFFFPAALKGYTVSTNSSLKLYRAEIP